MIVRQRKKFTSFLHVCHVKTLSLGKRSNYKLNVMVMFMHLKLNQKTKLYKCYFEVNISPNLHTSNCFSFTDFLHPRDFTKDLFCFLQPSEISTDASCLHQFLLKPILLICITTKYHLSVIRFNLSSLLL